MTVWWQARFLLRSKVIVVRRGEIGEICQVPLTAWAAQTRFYYTRSVFPTRSTLVLPFLRETRRYDSRSASDIALELFQMGSDAALEETARGSDETFETEEVSGVPIGCPSLQNDNLKKKANDSEPTTGVHDDGVTKNWSPAQRSYRRIMKALRGAYYNDRAKLFWARHRVLVEFYKYSSTAIDGGSSSDITEEFEEVGASNVISDVKPTNETQLNSQVQLLLNISDEIADFINEYMKLDVQRIVRHNEKMISLPTREAKEYREEYFLAEKQHESWCKQRIKNLLNRRPPPPYPFV